MIKQPLEIHGTLVAIPVPGADRMLDGFWAHGPRRKKSLLVLVHGMGGNFYRSRFRKELMIQARPSRYDALSFNNRGSERDVAAETFSDCVADIGAAVRFGRARGYQRVVLMGHSTGCQKIAHYQAVKQDRAVRALILGSIGDDLAICRRDLGREYPVWLKKAKRLVARGRGATILPPNCRDFSAARFLSIADPKKTEAALFDFAGKLAQFRKITCPVLVLMGSREEYACIPVLAMIDILREKSRAPRCDGIVIPGGDHGFHGKEVTAARAVYDWLGSL